MPSRGEKNDSVASAMPNPNSKSAEQMADNKTIDQAALFLAQTEECDTLTVKQEQRLKRKVDWIMIPMLFITATLGAVDKVALSTAAIYGLQEDNNLHGQQYSWLGSILSLGALVGMCR